jgi:hypothetical protein
MKNRLPDEYIDDARMRANRYMAQWTGTTGGLAADVRRLLFEREALIHELEYRGQPTRPRVIGLAGYAGAGKNAAAEATGGLVVGFADPLYAALAAMLGVPEEQLRARHTKELPMACGKSPRDLLRSLGTEWGRDMVRPDMWVWRCRQRIEAAGRAGIGLVVVCDVRFPNELQFIREELSGEVWWIDRPGIEAGSHVSDNSIRFLDCDRVINNDGTLDDLRMAVAAAMS